MFEYYLDLIKDPEVKDGIPQTGTALWEIFRLIEAGLDFPEEEIPFIETLLDGHFEQQMMASLILEVLDELSP